LTFFLFIHKFYREGIARFYYLGKAGAKYQIEGELESKRLYSKADGIFNALLSKLGEKRLPSRGKKT